jgi:hypothetical protein
MCEAWHTNRNKDFSKESCLLKFKRAGFAAACSLHAYFTDVSGKRFAIERREKLVVKIAAYIRAVIRSMELTTCDSSKVVPRKIWIRWLNAPNYCLCLPSYRLFIYTELCSMIMLPLLKSLLHGKPPSSETSEPSGLGITHVVLFSSFLLLRCWQWNFGRPQPGSFMGL